MASALSLQITHKESESAVYSVLKVSRKRTSTSTVWGSCEEPTSSQGSVFYVSINVFNIKKYNSKIQSEWCWFQIYLCTWSIQLKSTISSGFHIGDEGNQAGHQVLGFPEVLISLPSFRQSSVTGFSPRDCSKHHRVNPGSALLWEENLPRRWQSELLWMCVQQKYGSKECICRTWILAAWAPAYLWIK